MPTHVFKAEKDDLCFLGLMTRLYKMFDAEFIGPNGERTHTKGLNIHAVIVDNSFYNLWSGYYRKYDIHSQAFELAPGSWTLVAQANTFLVGLQAKIKAMANTPGTLFFDTLKDDLKPISDYFTGLTPAVLQSQESALNFNTTLLNTFQPLIS